MLLAVGPLAVRSIVAVTGGVAEGVEAGGGAAADGGVAVLVSWARAIGMQAGIAAVANATATGKYREKLPEMRIDNKTADPMDSSTGRIISTPCALARRLVRDRGNNRVPAGRCRDNRAGRSRPKPPYADSPGTTFMLGFRYPKPPSRGVPEGDRFSGRNCSRPNRRNSHDNQYRARRSGRRLFLGNAGSDPPQARRDLDPGRLFRRRRQECDLSQPWQPCRGDRDRVRSPRHQLPRSAGILFPDPRSDHAQPPGQ